ncbi:MAG: serine hydrolase [Pseudomonadota bacterium]
MAVAMPGASASGPSLPSDEIVRRILVERIDTQKQGVGIVVGLVDAQGRRIVAHGSFSTTDPRPVDGDTVFEIGSITKVFTSLLLADMARRGEVTLGDPVAKYLPAGVSVPQRDGRAIALVDLATHTSALPRLPENFAPANPANPYADYTVAQLYQFLSHYKLPRDIGTQFEYSNLGYGLLGHALARRQGTDYKTLVRERILAPLGMNDTGITLSAALNARLAPGHDGVLKAAPNWDLPALAGAGALRSTANDMMTFLEMALGVKDTPLSPALATALRTRRLNGTPGGEVALGWAITPGHDEEIVWHNGGTGGYKAFIGFLPRSKVGVVVLSNASTSLGVDDIGMHLLDPQIPLAPPPARHNVATVNPKIFDGYAGRYQLAPKFILTVTREGDSLFAQATGQTRIQLFPETPTHFFCEEVDAQIAFETDARGRATKMTLHQNGREMPAPRLPD